MTQVVIERYPELLPVLERAADRSDFPVIQRVRPSLELVRALPAGLCERLLAVPVQPEVPSERVDVAAVDVLDAHVAEEFAYHLRVPVRVLRAPFSELLSALRALQSAGIFVPGLSRLQVHEPPTPAPAAALSVHVPRVADEAPIPLVKRALTVNAVAWTPEVPAVSFTGLDQTSSQEPEPVLSLTRSKPFAPADAVGAGPPWDVDFEAAVSSLEGAETPDHVVAGLCEGLRPVRVLVFAVRPASFDVRGGSEALGSPAELRAVSVPAQAGSLLDAAVRTGFYLGPFAQLSALTPVYANWGARPTSDCYVRAVNIADRPSLLLLMAGFSNSIEATRRADVLARSAGSALERIVRLRKRG